MGCNYLDVMPDSLNNDLSTCWFWQLANWKIECFFFRPEVNLELLLLKTPELIQMDYLVSLEYLKRTFGEQLRFCCKNSDSLWISLLETKMCNLRPFNSLMASNDRLSAKILFSKCTINVCPPMCFVRCKVECSSVCKNKTTTRGDKEANEFWTDKLDSC